MWLKLLDLTQISTPHFTISIFIYPPSPPLSPSLQLFYFLEPNYDYYPPIDLEYPSPSPPRLLRPKDKTLKRLRGVLLHLLHHNLCEIVDNKVMNHK
jgi:hypothetical protein